MHNLFVAELFDWSDTLPPPMRAANWLLGVARTRIRLRRLPDTQRDMTNLEQRINLFHLMNQVLSYGVEGAVADLGCFEGQTAVLFAKVIAHFRPSRELHVYDSFEAPFTLRGSVKTRLLANFDGARLPPPIIHEGRLSELLPAQLPAAICLAHIDCGDGGEGGDPDQRAAIVSHCLEAVYPRMPRGAIGILMDYCDPSRSASWDLNPGVHRAAQRFFRGRPEQVSPLYSGTRAHGYFRKA